MAAYDFPGTAGQPTDGSFKYTAPDGTLYEWNGYAWEVPTGSGGGGGGGDAARVLTQVLPPSPAEDGDMYWCTDDGRLYIYYEDADTTQWVDASPDNIGADNGVTQIVAGNNVTLSPSIGKGVVTINSTGGGGGPTTPGVRYQQGTWTQQTSVGASTGQRLVWSRNGNLVTVNGTVSDFTNKSSNNAINIGGLPYLSEVESYGAASGRYVAAGTVAEVGQGITLSYIAENETGMNFLCTAPTNDYANATIKYNQCGPLTATIWFQLSYLTADTTFVPLNSAVVTEDIQGTGGSGGGTTVNYNGASAWASFNGTVEGVSPILASQNIASITRLGVGGYSVVFTTPLSSENYCVVSNTYAYTLNQTVNGFSIQYSSTSTGSGVDVFPGNFAVHSANAIAPPSGSGADAWGSVQADGTVDASFNVASVTNVTTGIYAVVFTTPMPTSNYAVSLSGGALFTLNGSKTTSGFNYKATNVNGTPVNFICDFIVNASSTVTPTYTWTRDGTTLSPANDGDEVVVAGDITVGANPGDGSGSQGSYINAAGQFSAATASGFDVFLGRIAGSDDVTSSISSDGSAVFKSTCRSLKNGYQSYIDSSGIAGGSTSEDTFAISSSNGSALFKGGVSQSNSYLMLEADNPANFSAEGEYTGLTLDVKELLLKLVTAADRISTLEAKVQTLESDHTTLMDNNNGGGY